MEAGLLRPLYFTVQYNIAFGTKIATISAMAVNYLIFVLMMATVGVLLAGIVLMSVGGKANQRYGNKLMVARVSLQGLVLLVLALLFFVSNK
jgi:hypothetical protein